MFDNDTLWVSNTNHLLINFWLKKCTFISGLKIPDMRCEHLLYRRAWSDERSSIKSDFNLEKLGFLTALNIFLEKLRLRKKIFYLIWIVNFGIIFWLQMKFYMDSLKASCKADRRQTFYLLSLKHDISV